jgi:hypothetical protein
VVYRTVNFGVCTYENEDQPKGAVFLTIPLRVPLSNISGPSDRVLNADVEDVGRLAKSQIFLIEGKRLQDKPLYDFMPDAISQAAPLCEVTGYLPSLSTPPTLNIFFRTTAVRFCLTDGREWIFSVFTKDERGRRVSYEESGTKILEPRLDPEGRDSVWEHSIHQIVELVYHWVRAILSASFVTYTDHNS